MRKRAIVAGSCAVLAAGALGLGSAVAGRAADDEGGKPTSAAERGAAAAALEITGGGTANAVERDSEDGATWEVEVTRADGSTVDVRLDAAYGLVVVEDDSETADDDD
jgi:hypothetical protein